MNMYDCYCCCIVNRDNMATNKYISMNDFK